MPRPKPPAKPRRPRGTGSIFQVARRGRLVWVARLPTGRKTRAGHTQYREISDPSQAKLVQRMRKVTPPGDDTTVAEWLDRWLDGCRVRPSTLDAYRYTVKNYLVPILGHLRVTALSHSHVDAAVRQWSRELGPRTVRTYLTHLRIALNAARKAGLIAVNPAADVASPKIPRRIIDPLSPADLSRLIAAATLKPQTWVIALLAATGMRVGEALALDVDDYDPRTGLVTISKTWTRQHGTRAPKSENSVRTIRVPESARLAMTRAIGGRKSGPVFLALGTRNRRRHGAVREAFAGLLAGLGIAPRNLHQLRHSVASMLVASGESLADCASFLGDSVAVVIATYLHPTSRDPSLVMDRLLSPEPGRGRKRG